MEVAHTRGAARAVAGEKEQWLMLAVLLLGQFMGLLDVYVVNVALPAIRMDLQASGAALQSIVAGYLVAYGTLLITGARLGALFGRRRIYMIGAAGFTAGSLLCGVAPNVSILVAMRCLQGASAAVMVPQVMSMIQLHFTGPARAKALSAYAIVLSLGAIIGVIAGGLLVSAQLMDAAWRPVFLVNVPLGLALLLLVPWTVPADLQGGRGRLDLAGLALAVPAVILLVVPLIEGREFGWPAWTFGAMVAAVVLATVFIAVEKRVSQPLVNLAVLRSSGFGIGLLAMLCSLSPTAGRCSY